MIKMNSARLELFGPRIVFSSHPNYQSIQKTGKKHFVRKAKNDAFGSKRLIDMKNKTYIFFLRRPKQRFMQTKKGKNHLLGQIQKSCHFLAIC